MNKPVQYLLVGLPYLGKSTLTKGRETIAEHYVWMGNNFKIKYFNFLDYY